MHAERILRLATFFLICFPFFLSAQNGRVSVGFVLSPERTAPSTFLYIYPDASDSDQEFLEMAKTTFSGGVVTQYWMNPYLSLRLGILYADKGYKEVVNIRTEGQGVRSEETNFRISYLSLPITAKLPLNQGPSNLYLSAGVASDIFLHGHGGTRSFTTAEFPQVSMSLVLGVGAEFPINDKMIAGFEPTFRMALSDYSLERMYRPFSLGLALGIFYQ